VALGFKVSVIARPVRSQCLQGDIEPNPITDVEELGEADVLADGRGGAGVTSPRDALEDAGADEAHEVDGWYAGACDVPCAKRSSISCKLSTSRSPTPNVTDSFSTTSRMFS